MAGMLHLKVRWAPEGQLRDLNEDCCRQAPHHVSLIVKGVNSVDKAPAHTTPTAAAKQQVSTISPQSAHRRCLGPTSPHSRVALAADVPVQVSLCIQEAAEGHAEHRLHLIRVGHRHKAAGDLWARGAGHSCTMYARGLAPCVLCCRRCVCTCSGWGTKCWLPAGCWCQGVLVAAQGGRTGPTCATTGVTDSRCLLSMGAS